jgi:CheY-like chemotaxis protein
LVDDRRSDISAYDREKYGTLNGYATDSFEICDELGLDNVILIGHSVSAMIAVVAAKRQAHDGLEAVRVAAEFQPDVVLMDIGLPVLNGYESAARIKAETRRPPVLVALTGWGQDEDRRKAKAAGFDAHLVKPVDHDALTKLIADGQS